MFAFVIGGSGSGKSEYAESLAVRLESGRKLYIATMYPWDEESRQRIEKHRRMRAKKNFDTIECFHDLKDTIEKNSKNLPSTVMLDCMSNLIANELYREDQRYQKEERLIEEIAAAFKLMKQNFDNIIIVSNDVFCDGIEYNEEMVKYLKCLGKVNQEAAKEADLVTEVVCKIPLVKKGKEPEDETIME